MSLIVFSPVFSFVVFVVIACVVIVADGVVVFVFVIVVVVVVVAVAAISLPTTLAFLCSNLSGFCRCYHGRHGYRSCCG